MTTEELISETTVNDSRSVTIPKSVCDELDVKPGDKVRWSVKDGELRVEVVSQKHGAFESFEAVDVGEETDAVEMEEEFGAT
jgi:AbrB family looped-hinge helix DNA binding protein